uniref:Uncharacterized protein n=1 Tax=Panagrolaimus superbus TaxID=310955 RepID=A0A914Y622_9BILA
MLAKRMGAKKVMVLIQRRAYVDLVQGSVIDIAISPQQATISALLSHVRKADIVGVSSLRRGVAEAIEAVAHGDESTSRVVGRVIDEIKLPPGTIIGAVIKVYYRRRKTLPAKPFLLVINKASNDALLFPLIIKD